MKRIEFGVRLPAGGPLASADNLRASALRAEQLGFDALWVHDFIVWTHMQDKNHVSCGATELINDDTVPLFYESLTNLAFLAGITTRPRLGVAVLCVPYRNPIVTAKQIANIDRLSNGRLILGVGPGGAKDGHNKDFEVLGVPRAKKWSTTAEYIKIMREIWTDPTPSYEGEYVSFEPTDINPKPVQNPIPLWGVGHIWKDGQVPKSFGITAELCDGWIPGFVEVDQYPVGIQQLKDLARQAGRGEVDFTVANEIAGCIAATDEEAFRKSDATLGVFTEGFQSSPSQERIRAASLVGSPETVRRKVQDYVDAGVQHFELKFIYHSIEDLLGQLELFANEVTPHFRPVAAVRKGEGGKG
jgi:probable F420-dependent oxidoreductase